MTEQALTFKTERQTWWLTLMMGVLNVIIGFLLLSAPAKTVFTLVVALGIYWIVSGIFTLVGMFLDHTAWGWKLFIGFLGILAGVVILRYPLLSTLQVPQILILLIGIQGFIVGVIMLILAFRGGGWGAGILGILSIIFGLVLMLNYWKLGTVVAFVWVTAIFALVGGIGQIFQAFRQRSD